MNPLAHHPLRFFFARISTFARTLRLGLGATLVCSAQASADSPAVYWTSSPVAPNQTVLIAGGNFGTSPVLEAVRLRDDAADESSRRLEDLKWQELDSLLNQEHSLQTVIPADWDLGVYAVRVDTGDQKSAPQLVNAPDVWWSMGDRGDTASPGGTLRLFGRALNFGGESRLRIRNQAGEERILSATSSEPYALSFEIPEDLGSGTYSLVAHNGHGGEAAWTDAGDLRVAPAPEWKQTVYSIPEIQQEIRDEGWAGNETDALMTALERAEANGGGIIYFPQGIYRIEEVGIQIPENVVIRGEDRDVVNLYWPAREHVLETFFIGENALKIENITMYTDGLYRTLISGNDDVTIHRVRMRANVFHKHEMGQPSRQIGGGQFEGEGGRRLAESGTAIVITGDRFRITDCDLYHTRNAIRLVGNRYGVVSGNRIDVGYSPLRAEGVSNLIWEGNHYIGADPRSTGIEISAGSGMGSSHHVYFAHNTMRQMYGDDREAVTLSGHGTAYLGGIASSEGSRLVLSANPRWETGHVDGMATWDLPPHKAEGSRGWKGVSVYVVDGKGVGQVRTITGMQGRSVELDSPWQVKLDESSRVSIGIFNGRHLFVDNAFQDAGFGVRLDSPAVESIVAGNTLHRATSLSSRGQVRAAQAGQGVRVEPNWYNQFLDNRIVEGNSWAGMGSEIRVEGTNEAGDWPITRWQVIRGNTLENNAELRVLGSVSDVVVEENSVQHNEVGVLVNSLDEHSARWVRLLRESRDWSTAVILQAMEQQQDLFYALDREEIRSLGDGSLGAGVRLQSESTRRPSNVLFRNNRFEDVLVPYIGDGFDGARLSPAPTMVDVRENLMGFEIQVAE